MGEKEYGKGKQYGNLKIVWHPDKLKSLKEKKITPPIYVRLKPTDLCDHQCFYCFYDSDILKRHFRKREQIPREKIMEILSDFKDMGVKAVTFSGGGEPLIYPYIEEALEKAIEYGLDISMITNGQKLEGKKAELLKNSKWVRISADSCTPATFSIIRNRPEEWFNILKENIRKFSQIKNPSCNLGINFVVHEKNWKEVYDSAKFFKDLGVNNIKFTPAWHPNFPEYHAPFKEKVEEQIERAKKDFSDKNFQVYETYQSDFSHTKLNERCYPKCYFMQIVPVIAPNQTVYFCHDKTYVENGALGSIKNQSFKELWFSKEAEEKFNNFNPITGCRCSCTNDSKNLAIHDMINCAGEHENFV